jgi:multidrug efflux system outer membrane protein
MKRPPASFLTVLSGWFSRGSGFRRDSFPRAPRNAGREVGKGVQAWETGATHLLSTHRSNLAGSGDARRDCSSRDGQTVKKLKRAPRKARLKDGRGRGALRAMAACLFLSSCAVGPDYHPPNPSAAAPAQWKSESPWKQAQPRDTALKENWWEIFEDPILSGLETGAATNSPDVRAAFARVEQARAQARVSRADLFPNLAANPSATSYRYTRNRPLPPAVTATAVTYSVNDFLLPLDLSYEVDLWGKVRRSFRSAREQAQANAAAYQTVLLSLQAEIAQTYFTIRSLDLERRVVGETIVLRRRNDALVKLLHDGGAASALDVARAGTELASAEGTLVALKLRRDQLENAVALLCGRQASGFSIAESTRTYRPPPIPGALPSELLERRPDVAEAERLMASASEQIGVAKAAFFPAIRLTGFAGVESADLKTLFEWESREWAFGPSVSLPLFEGGRNRAGLDRAKAAYEEAAAQYRSRVLTAFREVEDGLNGINLLKQEFADELRAVEFSRQAAELSRTRYKEGLASYFEVVDADRTYLETEILAYDVNGQSMVTSVLLIKALGGGWSAKAAFQTNAPAPPAKPLAQSR